MRFSKEYRTQNYLSDTNIVESARETESRFGAVYLIGTGIAKKSMNQSWQESRGNQKWTYP
jgi:hypothetical protein